eukprot:6772051-Pyramimonas_sp.AAC.1
MLCFVQRPPAGGQVRANPGLSRPWPVSCVHALLAKPGGCGVYTAAGFRMNLAKEQWICIDFVALHGGSAQSPALQTR